MNSAFKVAAGSIATVIAACPGSAWALRRLALAPVSMKTALVGRVLTRIAAKAKHHTALLDTNLGIADGLRCSIPAHKVGLLYSSPAELLSERATVALAVRLAVDSDAFIDVGANEGLFTFSVANLVGRDRQPSLHLFEPDGVLFERVRANLARNRIATHTNQVAVSDRSGLQTFYRDIDDDLSGSLTTHFASQHAIEAVETPVTTLADYLRSHDIERACVKIDVEGAGVAVWNGTAGARDRIAWLIYEILGPETQAGLARTIIADTGWSAYYIRDFALTHSVAGEYVYEAPFFNWLFCRHAPAELAAVLAGTKFTVRPAADTAAQTR